MGFWALHNIVIHTCCTPPKAVLAACNIREGILPTRGCLYHITPSFRQSTTDSYPITPVHNENVRYDCRGFLLIMIVYWKWVVLETSEAQLTLWLYLLNCSSIKLQLSGVVRCTGLSSSVVLAHDAFVTTNCHAIAMMSIRPSVCLVWSCIVIIRCILALI